MSRRPSRRDVLGVGVSVATWIAAGPARALGDAGVSIARLEVPGLPDPRPGALADLLLDLGENTSTRVDPTARVVDPEGADLFAWPWVSLVGDRAFDPLSDAAVANLRLYLRQGGFLFIDDASGLDRSDFDRSVRRDVARILPGLPLSLIGSDHALYRSFFLLRAVSGRVIVRPSWEGVWVGSLTPILYSRNDLLGAIWGTHGGRVPKDVIPGGENQRREARKWGVNLALYALTLDYKRDAVHTETLLERMRRDGGYGR